jgi:ribosomal protein L11 methyltransferase
MSYIQIIINIESTKVEQITEAFIEHDEVLAVSTTDQNEGTIHEEPIFIEPGLNVNELWQQSKITILLPENYNEDSLINLVTNKIGYSFSYTKEILEDQDWVELTQSQFDPIKITEQLYIVPSWHENSLLNKNFIILDPGLAFGTGSHPTTFMCLEWIANNISCNTKSCIDYGCGSGILAITAKKMGAQKVIATDIDEQAIESTISNANINKVELTIVKPNKLPINSAEIVIANILINPLIELANILNSITKETLILSGILSNQINQINDVYKKWFTINIENIKDEWVLLKCQKK